MKLTTAVQIAELKQENAQLSADLAAAKQQLEWFKRQLFGRKSEKRLDIDPAVQGNLFAALGVQEPPPPEDTPTETITYERKKARDGAVNDTGLRFSDDVPRVSIEVKDPEIEAIDEALRVRIGEKITYRLAQRPGSYVILEYTRPVYKILDDQRIVTTPAPANVLDRSVADVSFLVGMLVDKFCYHLPLYRQHQRLLHSGIQLSRYSLTRWAGAAIDLLRPIVDAQHQHVLQSRVLAMDEVPIKAGRKKKGKMRQAYFWPIYGEEDEIVFLYAPSREHRHVQAFLGAFQGILLSDGYEAYSAYVKHTKGVTQAGCWSHCRRGFERAQEGEPTASAEALALIGALYRHEEIIREKNLSGARKLAYRTEHSEPVCDRHASRLAGASPARALGRREPVGEGKGARRDASTRSKEGPDGKDSAVEGPMRDLKEAGAKIVT
jgi:transposase